MQLNFTNKFGALTLELVSGVRHVDTIFGASIDEKHKFDLRIAEKVALITDNRQIQIGGLHASDCYIVVHETPATGAIARIKSLNYIRGNPTQEIQNARREGLDVSCECTNGIAVHQ